MSSCHHLHNSNQHLNIRKSMSKSCRKDRGSRSSQKNYAQLYQNKFSTDRKIDSEPKPRSSIFQSRQRSSSHHGVPNATTDIKSIDNKTANKILEAFAKHVEKSQGQEQAAPKRSKVSNSTSNIVGSRQNKNLGRLDIQKQNSFNISEDQNPDLSKFECEKKPEVFQRASQEIDLNDNRRYPLTYRLYPKNLSSNKQKAESCTFNRKSQDASSTFREVKNKSRKIVASDGDTEKNQYLCIIPASDIDAIDEKKDMAYGPFYFVKKSGFLKDNEVTGTGKSENVSDFQNTSSSSHSKKPLDENKSRYMSRQDAESLIKNSVANDIQKSGSVRDFTRMKPQKQSTFGVPQQHGDGFITDFETTPDLFSMRDNDSRNNSVTNRSRPTNDKDIKYVKANIEFLIGVESSDVKLIKARCV